jgi:flagellar hook assembly protein FlgD
LPTLTDGVHSLKIKAWDVANNSTEEILDFVVAKKQELKLSHVLNYPNPFTTKTTFWFEHNQPASNLKVLIQIFSVTGKLVHQIQRIITTEGNRSNEIEWDGKDTYSVKLGRGVYIYKLSVTGADGKRVEKTEKLYLL